MTDMLKEADELRRLAARKPTAKNWAVVERSLASKWEGNQSLAIQVFQVWGEKAAVQPIRKFLEAAFERKTAFAVRKVAIKALATMVGPEDAGWIEALRHSRSSDGEKHELQPLLKRLSLDAGPR